MEDNKNNRGRTFFKNFGIYSVGVLGTRIITFLMVPLYTYFLDDTSDYGYYDLCLQLCMLLLPISTLQLRDGAFRFLVDNVDEEHRKKVVTFVCKAISRNIAIILIAGLLLTIFGHIEYAHYTVALLIAMTLHEVFGQITRGLRRNDIYVKCNLINALLIGMLSVLLVAIFKMGIEGIFLANIISRVVTVSIMLFQQKIFQKYFFFNLDVRTIRKEIFKYALPLIPTSLCWLFTTMSDRFFISYFVSMEANGIYAVTIRFTMILQTLTLIFYQTWQETAISQYRKPDRDIFFSKVFNYYMFALVTLLILYSYLLKVNYFWLVAPNYQNGVTYVYILGIITIMMNTSSTFFELGYQCGKDTKRAVPALFLSALLNVILNFLITPHYGVNGVIFCSFVTYLFLCVYRFIDTKRFFKIHIQKNTMALCMIVILGYYLFELNLGVVVDMISMTILLVLVGVLMPNEVKNMVLSKVKSI